MMQGDSRAPDRTTTRQSEGERWTSEDDTVERRDRERAPDEPAAPDATRGVERESEDVPVQDRGVPPTPGVGNGVSRPKEVE
jgi:hypothetical protein